MEDDVWGDGVRFVFRLLTSLPVCIIHDFFVFFHDAFDFQKSGRMMTMTTTIKSGRVMKMMMMMMTTTMHG